MPSDEYGQRMRALREETPQVGRAPAPAPLEDYRLPENVGRLSNIAMIQHGQGPFATIEDRETGKLRYILPGDPVPGPGGFLVEEITPEGVIVIPEEGPRQILRRTASQRQPGGPRHTESTTPETSGFYGEEGPPEALPAFDLQRLQDLIDEGDLPVGDASLLPDAVRRSLDRMLHKPMPPVTAPREYMPAFTASQE